MYFFHWNLWKHQHRDPHMKLLLNILALCQQISMGCSDADATLHARCPYICCSKQPTASSFSCDLGDSKHKCISNIMRLISHGVKGESLWQEKANVWSWNRYENAEWGCGQKEQFERTADCIMLLRWFGASSCDCSTCQLCACLLCLCVCPPSFIARHSLWGISSCGGLRPYSGSRLRIRRCHVSREGRGRGDQLTQLCQFII